MLGSKVTKKETFQAFPISDFTYDYIAKNMSISSANEYYKKFEFMNNEGTKVIPQPTTVTGILLNVPKQYTSTWTIMK